MPDQEQELTRPIHAVKVPDTIKFRGKLLDRAEQVTQLVDKYLQRDLAKGEKIHIRKLPNGQIFATKCPFDTLLFVNGHERQGESRYNWVVIDGGIELGYLVEGAESNAPPAE
jgi:hypothetical protein